MRKITNATHWWDWPAIILLFVLLDVVASRLATTNWTDFLFLVQTAVSFGYIIGVILGYSIFSTRTSRWLSFLYMSVLLPLQWTLMIDQDTTLEEQLLSVGGRLFFSYADFFARRPVEDAILFLSLASIGFWILGATAGFQLVRHQKYTPAVAPATVALLFIQNYDNAIEGRAWFIAFFAFIALLLLGRLNHLGYKQSWRERRVFVSPDNNIDIATIIAVAAGLLILVAWTPPASLSGWNTAERLWNRATRPWRDITKRMENATSALEGTGGGKAGEFYGPELALGQGFNFSDTLMFKVQAPQIPSYAKPPRYYWRGRTYDYFKEGQWYTTGASLTDYSPSDTLTHETVGDAEPAHFIFNTGDETFTLLYAPSQPVWISRQGSRLSFPVEGGEEIVSWFAYPALASGEVYQVDAVLSNPNTAQLREAGITYPDWVINTYLQLPDDFSPRIKDLALEITTETETPYDKSVAITRYLRSNMQYVTSLPRAPRNKDPLEWMLFENKQAYCVYYSTAEVLMLRSLGIPARLAVGFAEGERDNYEYTVRKENAHAWPEVYFPGIGWVEFEPTSGQPSLNRPAPLSTIPANTPNDLNQQDPFDIGFDRNEQLDEPVDNGPATPTETQQAFDPRLYLIPLSIILLTLTVYFSRRYSMPTRIPVLLRISFEQNGIKPPSWIIHWELWTYLTPIERAFQSVNFSLRLLGHPMPIDATPIERAKLLTKLLPQAENEISSLLDEHQTSLYTSRKADAVLARRAASKTRWLALLERVRYIFKGKPIEIL